MGDRSMTTPTLTLRASSVADDVRAQAAKADPMKALLTVLALLPFLLGYVAALVVRAVWTALVWAWAAAVVGWRAAYGSAPDDADGAG
jgi:hypothetical protein